MTSPHSPYQQHPGHGPGPSAYYHQPPQPAHNVYGGHNSGPNANYSYPYPPPPPHMSSHHPGMHPQAAPSRPNARGGSYSSRGHNPYNYYPPQHHPYAHPGSVPLHAPNPHPGPHNPYSPHTAKFNQPFSPAYMYPNPAAIPFTPPRHTPQPMSPLPKQLSAPPPNVNAAGFYEPVSAPPSEFSPSTQRTPTHIPSVPQIEEPNTNSPPPIVQTSVDSESISHYHVSESSSSSTIADAPDTSDSALQHSEPTSIPQVPKPSSYNQMGTIQTHDSTNPPSPKKASTHTESSPAVPKPVASWAIWSRRPHDPSHAPGVIISPRAGPPQNIVERAIEARTPPASPLPSPARLDQQELPIIHEAPAELDDQSKKPAVPQDLPEVGTTIPEAWSQTNSTVPSSAATETTDAPTVPGSPLSTNTSVSLAGTPAKEEKTLGPEPAAEPKQPTADIVGEDNKLTVAVESAKAPLPASQGVVLTNGDAITAPAAVSSTPAAAPAPAVVPQLPKKSWASLLRPASDVSGPSTGSKNALPTSSVVGFSIPASTSSAPSVPVSPSKKSELVNLLTTNPSNLPFASKIRPRGLVNSGNMCFANSVLQILVYCAPFHRLFVELGKVLPAAVGGKEGGSGKATSASSSSSSSTTPLVDATTLFLKEFLGEKKVNGSVNGMVNGAGVASGSGHGHGRGKGKEREVREIDDDDWDGDSFLPIYIYDAMKEKKRFDNMRGGHQEDAEEFLGFYLDTLEEELLSLLNSVSPSKSGSVAHVEEKEEAAPREDGWMEVGKKNRTVVTRMSKGTESPITRIFGGKFRSTLQAPRQKDSVVVEDWRSLQLDIQRDQIRTIQDALSYISHPQPVQVTLATQPGVLVEATQKVVIEALPPILILHIKRFCYDTNVKGVVKVGKQVQFGPELEVGPDLMAPAIRKSTPTRYKLFGALYHHGVSASGGHYTLDVLHPNRYPSANPSAKPREGWVRIDDELVSDVRPEDVFGGQDKDDLRCAYLLFYRRIW